MLNRRHLRIKAFQTIYAFQQADEKDRKSFEKSLLKSIQDVHESYILLFLLLSELSDFEERGIEERSSKYLPTNEDLNATAILHKNKFVQLLKNDFEFNSLVKKYKSVWFNEDEIMRDLINKIKQEEAYKSYSAGAVSDVNKDRELISVLFKSVIFNDPMLEQFMEEKFINWPVDKGSVEGMIYKTIRAFKAGAEDKLDILPITANWEEDKEFVLDLYNKTVLYNDECEEMISQKTKNWDVERIAMVDTILMKMAIIELINFNSIPTKVSMNEYIDISKEFSTPKSKGFINGILDKILIELKESGRVKKIGRGLIE